MNVREAVPSDLPKVLEIVNAAAEAYRGVIPADRWHEPLLLERLRRLTEKPLLIGTWADASWAIGFYRKNGFALVERDEKDQLLRKYRSIPARQVETSVVLADSRWRLS